MQAWDYSSSTVTVLLSGRREAGSQSAQKKQIARATRRRPCAKIMSQIHLSEIKNVTTGDTGRDLFGDTYARLDPKSLPG